MTSSPSHAADSAHPGSLLEGLALGDAAPLKAAPRARRSLRIPPRVAGFFKNKRTRVGLAVILFLALITGGYLYYKAHHQPDFATAPMDDLLNYTLLTSDFNNLPIDERLKLLTELIDRIKSMSGDDSSLMAAFAASINTDALRKQLEENASRLALDVWDKYALDYQKVHDTDKSKYLDDTFLNMTKLMESVGGVTSDKSDEQRLAEAREQAKRDQTMMSSGQGPTTGQLARMADMMRNRVGSHSAPQQQQRGIQLMRDMTRHLRGQDPDTGKKP